MKYLKTIKLFESSGDYNLVSDMFFEYAEKWKLKEVDNYDSDDVDEIEIADKGYLGYYSIRYQLNIIVVTIIYLNNKDIKSMNGTDEFEEDINNLSSRLNKSKFTVFDKNYLKYYPTSCGKGMFYELYIYKI